MTSRSYTRCLLGGIAIAFSATAALAENNNPTRARVDFDPVTGQPSCTIVSSSDPTVLPGTKFTCPPSVKARPPTTDLSTGATPTTAAGGDSSGAAAAGSSDQGKGPSDNQGRGHGPVIIAGALNGGAGGVSVLRLANFTNTAGTAQIAIVNPADGSTLANWTSTEVPSHGSIQIDLATVASTAILAPSATTIPAVTNLRISATFAGTVQHLIGQAGTFTDASACGRDVVAPRERLAFVPADTTTLQSWVRIVNVGTDPATTTLAIRNAASGIRIGTWTSPSVAAGGSMTVSAASIRTDASIDPAIPAVMFDTEHLAESLRLELLATSNQSAAIVDQTLSCGL